MTTPTPDASTPEDRPETRVMSEAEREEARRRIASASPAPWHLGGCKDHPTGLDRHGYHLPCFGIRHAGGEHINERGPDGAFSVFARTALPAALDSLDALERENERLSALLDEQRELTDAIAKTGLQTYDKSAAAANAGMVDKLTRAIHDTRLPDAKFHDDGQFRFEATRAAWLRAVEVAVLAAVRGGANNVEAGHE